MCICVYVCIDCGNSCVSPPYRSLTHYCIPQSLKVAADVGPAAQVVTDVAGSTLSVVGEALVSTSEIVSTSLNNATQELSEFATEMQNGPPQTEHSEEEPPKPTNTSV